MPNTKILLVEDDEKLGRQILGHLSDAGFDPLWARDGEAALRHAPDSVGLWILDLMLPGTYGLDVLKHVRRTSDVPVLVLSARDDTQVKVRALQLGADDYMTKPFWPEELIARVEARMRRPIAVREDGVELRGLKLDFQARRLFIDEQEVDLTRVEFDVLAYLARRPGTAVQRLTLAEHVLDPDREGTERTLDVHVSRLRKKLGARGACISTVWGVGYRFDEGGAE